MTMAERPKRYVVCLSNRGYAASLERRKIYVALADEEAERRGLIRVIDESGEDYLYPAGRFADVVLSPEVEAALAQP
jgi:hypothetical protein